MAFDEHSSSIEAFQAAMNEVCGRVRNELCVNVSDTDAVAIAIASACCNPEPLLDYALTGSVRANALKLHKKVALTQSEFVALFCSYANLTSKKLVAFADSQAALKVQLEIVSELKTTMLEPYQRGLWNRSPIVRVSAYVALLLSEDATKCFSEAISGIVGTETRRIEKLISKLVDEQEEGTDVILLVDAIYAIISAVIGEKQ